MQHFDAAATRQGLPYPALVAALHRAFASPCEVPPRQVLTIAGSDGAAVGTSLLMPAWRPGGRYGVKTVNVFAGNAAQGLPALHATYQLFDARTGVPLALIDGTELTTRRTVAASALAASRLARADARQLLVLGAGRLAAEVPHAMRTVRPGLQRVQVWNHRPERAKELAAAWRAQGLDAQAVADLATAVAAADIVSAVTLASVPVIRGAWLRPGTHVDLVGGFTPTMREADGECLRRARVWVDTEEALAKAGDLLQAIDEGAFAAAALQGTLHALCMQAAPARASDDEITLFKSVGSALEDLAAAELLHDGAAG